MWPKLMKIFYHLYLETKIKEMKIKIILPEIELKLKLMKLKPE
jgi:hypothetical protein